MQDEADKQQFQLEVVEFAEGQRGPNRADPEQILRIRETIGKAAEMLRGDFPEGKDDG